MNNGNPRIFVQTNADSMASGAIEVKEAIQNILEQQNISADVTVVGSQGMAFAEVVVDIMKPNKPRVTYGNVTPENAPGLIVDYIMKDDPRPDLALGTQGDGEIDGGPLGNATVLWKILKGRQASDDLCGVLETGGACRHGRNQHGARYKRN